MGKGINNFDELTTEVQQRRIQIRKFIAQSCELAKALPPRKRMLFLMRFDSGWSNQEIADLCNCSEATVARRLKEIAKELNAMRGCVNEEEETPAPTESGDG